MYLVYLGESGNTGMSVNDANQQHHVHVGLLVHEQQFVAMNGEFNALCRRHFGRPLNGTDTPGQIRASDVYQGVGFFKSWNQEKRAELIQDCLSIMIRRETPMIVSYVDKKKFAELRASEDDPNSFWGSTSEPIMSKLLFALNMYIDEMGMSDLSSEQIMDAPGPIKDYTLVIAGEGKSVEPQFMNQFLHSEVEIPTPAVLESFCYVGAEYSVCTQLANLCAYFVRRWLQNPDAIHGYFDALREGRVIQVIYPVQF